MRFARILVAGTALVSSAALAGMDKEHQAQSEAPSQSAPVMQDSQATENPWFSRDQENPWSSAARSDSESAASSELKEPNEAMAQSQPGEPPNEATALAPSESERPDASMPDPTRSETYTPPMGLGTDTYRS